MDPPVVRLEYSRFLQKVKQSVVLYGLMKFDPHLFVFFEEVPKQWWLSCKMVQHRGYAGFYATASFRINRLL